MATPLQGIGVFVPNSWSLHEARSEAPAEDRIEKE
jgi:hypothetical protein